MAKIITDLTQVPPGYIRVNDYPEKEAEHLRYCVQRDLHFQSPALKLMKTTTDRNGPVYVHRGEADAILERWRTPVAPVLPPPPQLGLSATESVTRMACTTEDILGRKPEFTSEFAALLNRQDHLINISERQTEAMESIAVILSDLARTVRESWATPPTYLATSQTATEINNHD